MRTLNVRTFPCRFAAVWSIVFACTASPARAAVTVYYTSPRTNEVDVTDGRTFKSVVTGVTHASGLALGPDGNLYVSEEGGDQIDRFSPSGTRVGAAFGGGRRYTSVTFGPDGLLYANSETDGYLNGYVRRYNGATGQARGSGISTSDAAQFSEANASGYSEGLAFGPDGNLYCPGQASGAVSVYQGPAGDHAGTLLRSITGAPTKLGKITFGPDGAAYVSQNDGKVLRYNGSAFVPFTSGHLTLPLGLAFGPEGDLYVADYLGAAIVRFQGPGGALPGAFIDIFAKTPQNPDDLIVVPEPAGGMGAMLAGSVVILPRRRRRRGRREVVCLAAAAAALVTGAPAKATVVIEVSDFSGGRVIQTDGVTKTTLISGLNQPMGAAFGPGGDLYVAQQSGARIGRYKANGQAVGATFGTGRPYTGLALGPDGEVYANGAENNYAAGVVERFTTSGAAHGTGLAPGNTAGFTSSFTSSYFEGLAFGPDGNLYVSAHGSGGVRVYQGPGGATPGSLVTTLTGVNKPDGLAFGPDGRLYVTEQDLNRVSRWNGAAFSVFASGSQFSTPVGLGFGPDGDLYVANYTGGNIAHFRGPNATTPGAFVSTFATGIGNPGYILVTPEPSTVALVPPCAMLAIRRRRRQRSISPESAPIKEG